MKVSRKNVIWVLIVAAVVGLIGYAATRKPEVSYETEKVAMGEVVEEVSVTGSLAPTHKIQLEAEATGKVIKRYVESGAVVKAGDPLVDLDGRDVAARVASARANVAAARARLAELIAGATAEELTVARAAVDTAASRLDSAVAAKADAEIALENARGKSDASASGQLQALLLDYDKAVVDANDAIARQTGQMFTNDNLLTFGTTSSIAESNARNSRGQAKAAVVAMAAAVAGVKADGSVSAALSAYAGIAANLTTVKAHLDDCREALNYTSSLSSATLAEYRLGVSSGLTALSAILQKMEADRSGLDLQAKVSRSEVDAARAVLTSATFAVETAQKSLAQAQADLALKKSGSRPETVASQRAQVEVQEAALTGYLTELSKRRIAAPIDGIVTDVPVELGETVAPGKAVVQMQTKGNFEITTNISEIDIGKVKVGDPVRITLDAFPKTETWTGKVVKIDPAEKVVEGVIFYETTVIFDAEDARLRSGMTANLVVETSRKDNVLRVPLRGLREVGSTSTVRVLRAGVPVDVDVTVGLQNNTHAEALTGLVAGDEVIVGETKK